MSVCNNERYVRSACESVLSQTVDDLELVVLDNGSTDASAAIVADLAAEDRRVRLVSREERSLIQSRNELLEMARSPIVAWMDSDDLARPRRLETQLAMLDESPDLVCVGGAALVIDPEGFRIDFEVYPERHEEIVARQMRGVGGMRFPCATMRRDVAQKVGGFRYPFHMCEDFDLFMRMSEVGRMANTSRIVLEYREHLRNTSRVLKHRWPVYRDFVLKLARQRAKSGSDVLFEGKKVELEFPDKPPPVDVAWETRDDWARRALRVGHKKTAWKHTARAIASQPLRLGSWKLCARVLIGERQLWGGGLLSLLGDLPLWGIELLGG